MSYHFYDMGFKDGYKKALQQLDEQQMGGGNVGGVLPGPGVLPGDVRTPGARPIGRIEKFTRPGGGRDRRSATSGDLDTQQEYGLEDGIDFFATVGPFLPYFKPGGFGQGPRPDHPMYEFWREAKPGMPAHYDVPMEFDLDGDGEISGREFRIFRRYVIDRAGNVRM
jgi:hypothetical protein